jgi:hypothetical protein
MMTPTLSGQLRHREGTKPSKLLDLNLLRSATDFDELPFQEGKPLAPSDKEEGLATLRIGNYAPKRAVFMVRIVEIQNTKEEASEHIQLDDYYIDDNDDYYFSDTPCPNMTSNFNSGDLPDRAFDATDAVKIEDEAFERNTAGSGTPNAPSAGNAHQSSISLANSTTSPRPISTTSSTLAGTLAVCGDRG